MYALDDRVPFDGVPGEAVAVHDTFDAAGCVVPGPAKVLVSAVTEIFNL